MLVCLQNDVKLVVNFSYKFEAELRNKVMIYSKEGPFDAFWKFILKNLPFFLICKESSEREFAYSEN